MFEALGIDAAGGKTRTIGTGGVIATEFADERRAEAESGGVEGGIGSGAAGSGRGRRGEQGDQAGNFLGGDVDRAALLAGRVGEKGFRHGRDEVHDGSANADQIEGGWRGSGSGGSHGLSG